MINDALSYLSKNFSTERLQNYFRLLESANFTSTNEPILLDDEGFGAIEQLGMITSSAQKRISLIAVKTSGKLTIRNGRKKQYDLARKLGGNSDAIIVAFYDDTGAFRLSLVYPIYSGSRRTWSNAKRHSFFVDPKLPNKTFLQQVSECDFVSMESIQQAFSAEKVSELFYTDFIDHFHKLEQSVRGTDNERKRQEFVLIFVIRVIFIGFIQKRGWIADDHKFLQNFLTAYRNTAHDGKFYDEWLKPLFFDALSKPIGTPVHGSLTDDYKLLLKNAPYLNGGLFELHEEIDKNGVHITDEAVSDFFDFLFSFNFTVEENTLYDEDLELNPEFLGIIFERYVNKEDGAVYTPRTEVDFMCRISLLKWLQGNLTNENIDLRDLYELFFREGGNDGSYDIHQKHGSFSEHQRAAILELLRDISICDPAVGSGAFPVGMMHVLDEIERELGSTQSRYAAKKRIIGRNLYGVEVKKWAVWICQLRLWLTLFIDAPDDLRYSPEPILPSLDFKILQGDSIVQTVAGKLVPVNSRFLHVESTDSPEIQNAIKSHAQDLKSLRKLKNDFFQNKYAHFDRNKMLHSIHSHEVKLHNDAASILGARTKLQQAFISSHTQTSLIDPDEPTKQLDFGQAALAKLKAELAETQQDVKEPITIWDISFAEVFQSKGGFDIVIGNPPYVRQEFIADPVDSSADYKDKLAEVIKQDYWANKDDKKFRAESQYDRKSDLFVYFYLHTLKLLNKQGIHTFICSNSWLDVGYGAWLQKFLLNNVQLHAIYDSQKRSFASADVNTIITVMGAPSGKPKKPYKLVAFKKSYEDSIFTENLLDIENAFEVVKNDKLRVYPIHPSELLKTGTENYKYIGDKWGGKYLRAPDIFFTILDKGKDKMVKLKDVAEVKFGIKTGANDFFYITPDRARSFQIPEKYLKDVIFSFKNISSIHSELRDVRYRMFVCNTPIEELDSNTRKYIEWGESQIVETTVGGKKMEVKGFNNKPSVSGRRLWYSLGDVNPAPIIFSAKVGERFFVYENTHGYLEDKKLYEITTEPANSDNVVLWLNSTLVRLYMELTTRELTGAQAILDITVKATEELPFLEGCDLSIINKSFYNRPIKGIFEECGIDPKSEVPIDEQEPNPPADRAALDEIIFDTLGLNDDERKEIYRSVCRLVHNRLTKAKSV
jgi:hypothetical protein